MPATQCRWIYSALRMASCRGNEVFRTVVASENSSVTMVVSGSLSLSQCLNKVGSQNGVSLPSKGIWRGLPEFSRIKEGTFMAEIC